VKFSTCTLLDVALTWWNSQIRSLGPDAYSMTWEVLKKMTNKVYNMGTGERKPYSGNLPKCTKCHFHHNAPCTQKYHRCNKVGHFARDCKSSGNANIANAQRNNGENPKGNGCFECGATWHFKKDFPKLKNKDGEKTPPAPQDKDERELMFIQPHDPDYVPEPMYPEYIPLEDEHVLPAEEQPLLPVDSPTAESPGYVAESNPEEYEDDETEDGSVYYPMDEGDNGDDDDSDSSGDDVDDEDEEEEDEEKEEEEHLAPVDSAVVIPNVELVSPPKGTDPALIDALTAALPSPLLPPPLYIPLLVDRRDDVPETEMPPHNRDTWVDMAEAVPEIAPMTLGVVNTGVTELAELHEHDTQDLYALLEDVQDRDHYAAREAWDHSIGLSQAVHSKLQTHREQVYAHEFQLHAHQTQLQLQGILIQTHHRVHETRFQIQQAEIAELQEADRRRQAQMVETLQVMGDIRWEMGDM
nr:hypothetical protein [Tanacetum cinerariifolium]